MDIGNNYLEAKILTAAPEQLVVIMYEEAIKSLQISKREIESNNFAKANQQLYKAQLIIGELMSALDPEYKEITENLLGLYSNVYDQIVQANVNKDINKIDSLVKLLSSFLAAWREAARKCAIETQSSNRALTY